jgi:hypothetical protein
VFIELAPGRTLRASEGMTAAARGDKPFLQQDVEVNLSLPATVKLTPKPASLLTRVEGPVSPCQRSFTSKT